MFERESYLNQNWNDVFASCPSYVLHAKCETLCYCWEGFRRIKRQYFNNTCYLFVGSVSVKFLPRQAILFHRMVDYFNGGLSNHFTLI